MSFELLLPVSILAGFVGAMSGMGGGVILIPALTFFGMDIKRAIALPPQRCDVISSSLQAPPVAMRAGFL